MSDTKFNATKDAERLRSVARVLSYNGVSEAVWKHCILEIAMRLETGAYIELAKPDPEPVACARHRVHAYSSKVPTVSGGYKYVFFVAPDRPSNATLIFDAVENYIPLYTQPPAQQKPLSDDEIIEIYNQAAANPKNAWKITGIIIDIVRHIEKKNGVSDKLYTNPSSQQKPLSDEQITKCYETTGHCQTLRPQDRRVVFDFARAIEAENATLRATMAAMREAIAHLNNQIRQINRAIEKHHMHK